MNSEEIKNEFINCIEGTHTLNLAVSILEDREEYKKEIERLTNIIEKYKKHLKEYDEWLDYNTKLGNLYWYDATPFPKLELKGSNKE